MATASIAAVVVKSGLDGQKLKAVAIANVLAVAGQEIHQHHQETQMTDQNQAIKEPLTTAPFALASPIRKALERLLFEIESLADRSEGVQGLHQNGDLAPWSELLEEGHYLNWLGDAMAFARATLAAEPPATGEVTDEK